MWRHRRVLGCDVGARGSGPRLSCTSWARRCRPVPFRAAALLGAKDSPAPPGGTGAEQVPRPVVGGCTLCLRLQRSERPARVSPGGAPRPGPGGSRGNVPSGKPSHLLRPSSLLPQTRFVWPFEFSGSAGGPATIPLHGRFIWRLRVCKLLFPLSRTSLLSTRWPRALRLRGPFPDLHGAILFTHLLLPGLLFIFIFLI